MVQDHLGNQSITLEISYANASSVRPNFKAVAFYELDEVRALYAKLGGGRAEGAPRGSTVIIPNRSRWANVWSISADEVQGVSVNDELQSLGAVGAPRARNRLLRDCPGMTCPRRTSCTWRGVEGVPKVFAPAQP